MATIITERDIPTRERFVLYKVGWAGYQQLLAMTANRRVRVTYDRGDVELMAPLPIHEAYKHLLGRIVETICEELDLPWLKAVRAWVRSDVAPESRKPPGGRA